MSFKYDPLKYSFLLSYSIGISVTVPSSYVKIVFTLSTVSWASSLYKSLSLNSKSTLPGFISNSVTWGTTNISNWPLVTTTFVTIEFGSTSIYLSESISTSAQSFFIILNPTLEQSSDTSNVATATPSLTSKSTLPSFKPVDQFHKHQPS